MKKTVFITLAFLLAFAIILGGCSSETTPTTEPDESSASESETAQETEKSDSSSVRTVEHVWGSTEIDSEIETVVALDFSFVDSLVAIGVTPAGVAGAGETEVPEYLEDQIGDYTYVGDRREPNLEVIHSLNPDLIIANPERHEMIKNDLDNIAPTIALNDNSYQEVLNNTVLLADLLGKEAEAEKVKQELDSRLQEVAELIEGTPSVLVAGGFDNEFSVWIKDSFIGSIMTGIDMNYLFDGEKSNTEGKAEVANMTVERLAELNPDYLFIYGDYESWKDHEVFQTLEAAQQNRVYPVDRNLWSRGRGPLSGLIILDEIEQLFAQ
jgi:iron complex transport system substrate-binding protein